MAAATTALIRVDSPIGPLVVTVEGCAVTALDWGTDAPREPASPLLARVRDQLAAYFAGNLRAFDLPLAPAGSPFQQAVWRAMQAIPYGETRSYGALAAALDSAARAVGGACGRNPIPVIIPCHRVIGSAGLGGYSGLGGAATKRRLLALEGATSADPGPLFTAA